MKPVTAPAPLLVGAPNFRDLGGYATADGRRVRKGMLYRSEGLCSLTPDDLSVLNQLGIRLVCDIRSEHERRQAPNRWPAPPLETLHLNVSADLRAGYNAIARAIRDDPSEQGASAAMLLSYRQFPAAFAGHLANLFERILSDTGIPLVFHCAAGKDRTGFVAAMLLSALDVAPRDILADYLLTSHYWHGPRTEASLRAALAGILDAPPPPGVVNALSLASPDYLQAAFSSINEEYGSVHTYLETTAGLDTRARQALQARLLK